MDKIFKGLLVSYIFLLCTACTHFIPYRCGTSCTDEEITTNVQTRIAGDACLYYQNINVYTFERVVALEGTVESPTQAVVAVKLARSVPRVKYVISKLLIRPYVR